MVLLVLLRLDILLVLEFLEDLLDLFFLLGHLVLMVHLVLYLHLGHYHPMVQRFLVIHQVLCLQVLHLCQEPRLYLLGQVFILLQRVLYILQVPLVLLICRAR